MIRSSLSAASDSIRLLERLERRIDPASSAGWWASANNVAEEVWTSMRLAGSPLEREETRLLIRAGLPLGHHSLDAYVAVADYASAARYVADATLFGRRRPLLRVEEIAALHQRAVCRTAPRPGALRETRFASAGGIVAPAPWMVPQALNAFVTRFRTGPPDGSPALWAAGALASFGRIAPFDSANGRVGRLVVNLLLRRAGYAAFVVRPRDAQAYRTALRAAEERDRLPLGLLVARSLIRTSSTTDARTDDARPLSEFADGAARAALYKAAQRGRLRAFHRDGRLYTSAAWIDAYRARTRNA